MPDKLSAAQQVTEMLFKPFMSCDHKYTKFIGFSLLPSLCTEAMTWVLCVLLAAQFATQPYLTRQGRKKCNSLMLTSWVRTIL